MSLHSRLDKLERDINARRPRPARLVSLDDALASFERCAGLPVGSLSRSAQSAAAQGYDSIAGEAAAAVGMEIRGLKAALAERARGGAACPT